MLNAKQLSLISLCVNFLLLALHVFATENDSASSEDLYSIEKIEDKKLNRAKIQNSNAITLIPARSTSHHNTIGTQSPSSRVKAPTPIAPVNLIVEYLKPRVLPQSTIPDEVAAVFQLTKQERKDLETLVTHFAGRFKNLLSDGEITRIGSEADWRFRITAQESAISSELADFTKMAAAIIGDARSVPFTEAITGLDPSKPSEVVRIYEHRPDGRKETMKISNPEYPEYPVYINYLNGAEFNKEFGKIFELK